MDVESSLDYCDARDHGGDVSLDGSGFVTAGGGR
jgi:hypothetical protein